MSDGSTPISLRHLHRGAPGRQRHRRLPHAEEQARVAVRATPGRRGSRPCSGRPERRRAERRCASAAQCPMRSDGRRRVGERGQRGRLPHHTVLHLLEHERGVPGRDERSEIEWHRGPTRPPRRTAAARRRAAPASRPCPTALRGSGSARISQCAGTLKYASASRAPGRRARSASSVAPGAGTTTAFTSWPSSSWSTAITATSATPGCSSSRFSISTG